jgi:hypothetical protein
MKEYPNERQEMLDERVHRLEKIVEHLQKIVSTNCQGTSKEKTSCLEITVKRLQQIISDQDRVQQKY